MRSIYTSTLLLILCAHWSTGFTSLRQMVHVEIPQYADPATARLAHSFQEKHGLYSNVHILDSLDHKFLNVTGYGTAFVIKGESDTPYRGDVASLVSFPDEAFSETHLI